MATAARTEHAPAINPSDLHSTRLLSLRHQTAVPMSNGARNPQLEVLGQMSTPDEASNDEPTSKVTFDSAVNIDGAATDEEAHISISTTSKLAGQQVAPFLAKHIPNQYNPLGNAPLPSGPPNTAETKSNTKYCYRHRPDLKCRRQANEPSMEQLQNELGSLSQSDQQGIAHVWSLFSAAPSKQRNLMLQGILAQCCFPQLSLISSSVRDLIKIDFLSALPPELGFKILCYLDTTSLCKAAQVSQRWRTMADDDVVWHKMCEQHIDRKCTKCGWGLPLLERKRLRIEKRQIQLRASGQASCDTSPNIAPMSDHSMRPHHSSPLIRTTSAIGKRSHEESGSLFGSSPIKRSCTQSLRASSESAAKPKVRPWKDVYKDRFRVGTNWKYGRCSVKTLKGHTNGIMCLQFDDSNNVLMTGSYDSTVKIWDIQTGQEIRTLTGHTAGVRCLKFDDSKLITGSMDRTLKVWNWRTGECLRTIRGHSAGIIGLDFSAKYIASGSADHTIRVWHTIEKQTFLLRDHTDWVNAVKIDTASRTLFSASDDLTVRLWDLDTKVCIRVFEGHVGQVQQVIPLPPDFEFEAGDEDDDGKTSDADTDDGQDNSSAALPNGVDALDNFRLPGPASASATPEITPLFDANDPERPAPPRYMLTGALDNTIRLWDVRTGKCLRTFFGHVEGVWALASDTLRLVSGAQDRMVKVWDPRTGKCQRTFTGHEGPVTCVGLSDSRMVSAGEDCEIRIYSFQGEENGPSNSVTSLNGST